MAAERSFIPSGYVMSFWLRCVLVGHFDINHSVYLLFRNITPFHTFGRVDIPCKGVERKTTVIPYYGNDVFQHNHVAPYRVGAAFPFRAQKILEIVDECKVQLFKGNIIPLVSVRKKLAEMLINGLVAFMSLAPCYGPTFLANSLLCCSKSFSRVSCLTPIPR